MELFLDLEVGFELLLDYSHGCLELLHLVHQVVVFPHFTVDAVLSLLIFVYLLS